MHIGNTAIAFEQDDERLKVVVPIKRNTLALAIYTILLVVWIIALFLFVYLLFRPPAARGIDQMPPSLRIVWVIGVVLWLFVWIFSIGKRIWRWWQFYFSTREILIADEKMFIVRRPFSLLGITDAYDREHMAPFYESERHKCLSFQYGNVHHILFGTTLDQHERTSLITFLNQQLFPNAVVDDDDDED